MNYHINSIKTTIYKFRYLVPLIVVAGIAFCYFYFPSLQTQEKITLISAFVVAGSLIYTLIIIEGSERTFTYNICADWYKTDLNKFHVSIFYFTTDDEINKLIKRFNDKVLEEKDEERFQKIVSILNYFQMIATFYIAEKVDKSIIKDNFKHIIIKYCKKFEEIIKHVNDNNENQPLLELQILYKKFKPEKR